MKVELLVNMKYDVGKVWGKGSIFNDPIPPEIMQEVNSHRNTVRVIEGIHPTRNPEKSSTPAEGPIEKTEVEKPKAEIAPITRKKK